LEQERAHKQERAEASYQKAGSSVFLQCGHDIVGLLTRRLANIVPIQPRLYGKNAGKIPPLRRSARKLGRSSKMGLVSKIQARLMTTPKWVASGPRETQRDFENDVRDADFDRVGGG